MQGQSKKHNTWVMPQRVSPVKPETKDWVVNRINEEGGIIEKQLFEPDEYDKALKFYNKKVNAERFTKIRKG